MIFSGSLVLIGGCQAVLERLRQVAHQGEVSFGAGLDIGAQGIEDSQADGGPRPALEGIQVSPSSARRDNPLHTPTQPSARPKSKKVEPLIPPQPSLKPRLTARALYLRQHIEFLLPPKLRAGSPALFF